MAHSPFSNPSKKGSSEVEAGLSITSLMDAFTIILVFLVKQYGVSVVDVAAGLTPPEAETRIHVDRILTLQVRELAPGAIGYRIGDAQTEKQEGRNSQGSYPQLTDDLRSEKELVDAVLTEEELKGAINIIGDHNITYETLIDVMKTVARAGFYKLKLVSEPAA